MEKIMKWLAATVGGVAMAFAKQYALLLVFVVVIEALDTITGLIKAQITGVGWNSKVGKKGFFMKVLYLVALGFGFFLDYFIPYMLSIINVQLPFSTAIFGMIIGFYIIINECISICENLYECNPNIIPKWISRMLNSAKKQIEDKGDGEDEER